MFAETQLAQIEPYTLTSPTTRLKELQAKYNRDSAIYSPTHPDMVRVKKEITLLKAQTGEIDEYEDLAGQLMKVQANLRKLGEKYSDSHPDIMRLKKREIYLKVTLNNTLNDKKSVFLGTPDNPQYMSVQSQLESINLQLKAQSDQYLD